MGWLIAQTLIPKPWTCGAPGKTLPKLRIEVIEYTWLGLAAKK